MVVAAWVVTAAAAVVFAARVVVTAAVVVVTALTLERPLIAMTTNTTHAISGDVIFCNQFNSDQHTFYHLP